VYLTPLFDCHRDNPDVIVGLVGLGVGLDVTDILHHFHPLDDPPEHRVLVVEPRRRRQGDKKLTPVGIRPRIGHRHRVRPVVPQIRPDFVLELAPPDALAPGAVPGGVPRLHHEPLDHPVEDVSVVVAVLGVDAEVLHRLRRVLDEEFHVDVAEHRVEDGVLVEALDGGVVGGGEGVLFGRLLVEDVAVLVALEVVGFAPAEQVEAGFLVSGADEGGVGLDGFEGGVVGGFDFEGHGGFALLCGT
jgi:hypothetical protein